METVRSGKKYLIVLVLIVAVVGGAYLLWDRFSETGKTRRWAREAAEAVEKGEKAYVDAMTADWHKNPSFFALLERISSTIVNNVRGVNRVLYDITQKPPATMEYE